MTDELLTPKQRKIAYLLTAIGNGMLFPLTALGAALPLWAVCLIGGWNAAVAALALSNTPSTPTPAVVDRDRGAGVYDVIIVVALLLALVYVATHLL